MPRLRKIAYEKFAQFVASGLSLAESYRRTTGQTKNADVKGHQWGKLGRIKERIAELKAQNSQRAQMTRDELLSFYSEVIRTPADRVLPGSPVIQAYEQDGEGRVKVRICDKVQAGQNLARMCGWESATKVDLNVNNPLSNYIRELRAEPLFGGPVLSIKSHELPLENGEHGENSEESAERARRG